MKLILRKIARVLDSVVGMEKTLGGMIAIPAPAASLSRILNLAEPATIVGAGPVDALIENRNP